MAPNNQTRVAGGGNTFFRWDGNLIAYGQSVTQTGVQPVAPAQVIQPLNETRPVEIITPVAHTNGVLTLTLIELVGASVWQRLSGLTGAENVVDIMKIIARRDNGVRIQKVLLDPKHAGAGNAWIETFYNCVITRVGEDETIAIDTMSVNKEIEVWYTHSDKGWIAGSSPLDAPLNG